MVEQRPFKALVMSSSLILSTTARATPGLGRQALLRPSAKFFALGMVPEVKINAQNQKNPLRFENRCERLCLVS